MDSPDIVYKVARRLRPAPTNRDSLPLGNKGDPLDELLFIIVTTMTQYGAIEAYDSLKASFATWDLLLEPASEKSLRAAIERCGLVNQKAPQIIAIARRLQTDFGRVTLAPLESMTDEDAEAYLLSLPRVGKKVARCVMMYSLNRDVLPVDTHVLRVSKRLGLLPEDTSWSKAHNMIHEVVPPELRYTVHVGFVEHGRIVCTHKNPACAQCNLNSICPKSSVKPG